MIGSDDMKIEKLNDNQIRCTLTHADLADRQLKLSELVCGSEKAKSLFQDMMQQAASEFGFETEDMPLMIEAIPAAPDCITLIITKVDDPEALDSKFSKFGSTWNDFDSKKRNVLDKLEGAEEIFDLLQKVKDAVSEPPEQATDISDHSEFSHIRLFSFSTLDHVIHACQLLTSLYKGFSTLYKDTEDTAYILALSQPEHTDTEFHKICNMLSEYGSAEKVTGAVLAFLEEHCDVIVSMDAVQQLGNI